MIVFPDVETHLVNYLAVDGLVVRTKHPTPYPDEYVRLRRIGGFRKNLVTEAVHVIFEVFSTSDPATERLAATIKARVHAMPDVEVEGMTVRRVREIGGLANYPDPENARSRYQFTLQIETKGVPA